MRITDFGDDRTPAAASARNSCDSVNPPAPNAPIWRNARRDRGRCAGAVGFARAICLLQSSSVGNVGRGGSAVRRGASGRAGNYALAPGKTQPKDGDFRPAASFLGPLEELLQHAGAVVFLVVGGVDERDRPLGGAMP